MVSLAIVGATGAVGRKVLEVLERRGFPLSDLRLFASERSAGQKVTFRGRRYPVWQLHEDQFRGVDIVIFDTPSDVSKEWCRRIRKREEFEGVIIDNSSAFRMDPLVPLVVPEINGDLIPSHRGIIANPNCTTAITLMAIAPLHKAFRVKRIVATTFQAVSGAGQPGIEELDRQMREWKDGKPFTTKTFPHPIAFNVIPQVEDFTSSGYTKEEEKLWKEGAKILGDPGFEASVTCVRVPVYTAHTISVMAQFEKPITSSSALNVLEKASGIYVADDPRFSEYPTPANAAGKDYCLVGRIRDDCAFENALSFVVSGDQLLKGAALNAVQIAEYLAGE